MPEANPVMRRPDASGERIRYMAIGAMAVAMLMGFLFSRQPALAIVGPFGLGYIWFAARYPAAALSLFLFALIAVPVYIRLPPVGPLPPPPVAISMLFVLVIVAAADRFVQGPKPLWHKHGKTLITAMSIWGVVTLTSLVDPRTTMEGVNMWVKAFVFPVTLLLVATRIMRSPADVDLGFKAMLAAAVVTSLYAVWEYFQGTNWLLETFLVEGGLEWGETYFTAEQLGSSFSYRSFSVFSQPIEFGTCVGMIYPYALIQVGVAPTSRARWIYGLASLICVAGVLATFSRMPLLALTLSTIFIAAVLKPLRIWLVSFMGLACGGLLIAWPWIGEMVSNRVNDIDNVTLRVKLWETARALFWDHPFRGIGFGNFPEYQKEAIRAHGIGPFPEFEGSAIDRIRVAETTYFQLAAETGTLGLLAFAAMVASFVLVIIHVARCDLSPREKNLLMSISISAAVYFLNGATITAYTHFTATILLLGVLFSFALVLERCAKTRTGPVSLGGPVAVPINSTRTMSGRDSTPSGADA